MAKDQVRIVIGRLEEVTEEVITKISVNTTAELIEATPVDTGWARANWVPSIGRRANAPETPTDPELRRQASRSAATAQSAGTARLVAGGYSLNQGAVFISNGVPYLVFLNEGTSQQAPKAFVQQGIVKGVNSIRGLSLPL